MLLAVCLTTAVHAQSQTVTVTECDTVTDCDNLKYPTVRLGNVCWMSKNLATESCVALGNVYAYESTLHTDVAANVAANGLLYDEIAVMQDSSVDANGHVQGICPDGWYLPTVAYFEQLKAKYSADDLAKAVASRNFWFNVETPPITYTINHDPVARPCSPQYQGPDYLNDASYFSAIPAGAWYDNLGGNMDTLSGLGGREFDPGKDAHFWSSSTQPGSDSTGYFFRLGIVTYDVVALAYDALKYGRSVRCLRDEPATNSMGATSVTKPSDTLLGMMTTSDDEPIATQDFEWQDSYVTMMFKLCGKIRTSRNASIITGSPSMFTTPGAGRSTVMVFACTSVR